MKIKEYSLRVYSIRFKCKIRKDLEDNIMTPFAGDELLNRTGISSKLLTLLR